MRKKSDEEDELVKNEVLKIIKRKNNWYFAMELKGSTAGACELVLLSWIGVSLRVEFWRRIEEKWRISCYEGALRRKQLKWKMICPNNEGAAT